MNYLFVFTLGITIINIFSIISIAIGNKVIFPHYKGLRIDRWYFMYPCFFYQVYWWSVYLELIEI